MGTILKNNLFNLTDGTAGWNPYNFIPEDDLRFLITIAIPRQIKYEEMRCQQHEQGIHELGEATYNCCLRMLRRMHRELAELTQVHDEIQRLKLESTY